MSAKSKDKTAVENKEPVKVLTFPHSFTLVQRCCNWYDYDSNSGIQDALERKDNPKSGSGRIHSSSPDPDQSPHPEPA